MNLPIKQCNGVVDTAIRDPQVWKGAAWLHIQKTLNRQLPPVKIPLQGMPFEWFSELQSMAIWSNSLTLFSSRIIPQARFYQKCLQCKDTVSLAVGLLQTPLAYLRCLLHSLKRIFGRNCLLHTIQGELYSFITLQTARWHQLQRTLTRLVIWYSILYSGVTTLYIHLKAVAHSTFPSESSAMSVDKSQQSHLQGFKPADTTFEASTSSVIIIIRLRNILDLGLHTRQFGKQRRPDLAGLIKLLQRDPSRFH